MPERITTPGPVSSSSMRENCEAVCIHTTKIYDSCREEDIAALRYYYQKSFSSNYLKRAAAQRRQPPAIPRIL